MLGSAEINRRLGYHPATVTTIPLHEEARARFIDLACWMDDNLPTGRDLAEAHTELQHTLWAVNAVIACNLAPLGDPATRVPNPLVQSMASNALTRTLTVGVACPEEMPAEQVAEQVRVEVLDRLQRSAPEQSSPRVKGAPQA